MDIWDILGIEESAGIDEIRAAYSEKVKEFHPEDDPEGFMRVREAYKAAIRMASDGASDFAPPDAWSDPKPSRTAKSPQSITFDFSEVEEQTHEHAENRKQESSFDFSGIDEQESEHDEIRTTESDFDFSEVGEQTHERVENREPEPAFDFSDIERAAAGRLETEKQFADQFIARLTSLCTSHKRKRIGEWKALFTQSSMDRLKRNEYFVKYFLDFLEFAPGITATVYRKILDPFIAELRLLWKDSPLWGNFDVRFRKNLFKRSVMKIVIGVIAILFFRVLLSISNVIPVGVNNLFDLLVYWYETAVSNIAVKMLLARYDTTIYDAIRLAMQWLGSTP